MNRRTRTLAAGLVVLTLSFLGCGGDEEGAKSNCQAHQDCICQNHSSPLMAADTRRLLCQLASPSQTCAAFEDEEACQALCLMSYQSNVSEDFCAVVSGTSGDDPVRSDMTGTQVLSLLSADAEAWAAGAYPTSLSCMNLNTDDGTCHGWQVTYRAPDVEGSFQFTAVTGLTPTSKPLSFGASGPLAEGWLDSDDIAATVAANRPSNVVLVHALLSGADAPVWTTLYWHMENNGTSRVGDEGVRIDALTGDVVE